MSQSHRFRGVLLFMLITFVAGILLAGAMPSPVVAAPEPQLPAISLKARTIQPGPGPDENTALDDAPLVVDFGGVPADAPVAGLDQWQARHSPGAVEPMADVLGPKKVMVLRVYFDDYANTSRYTKAEVEDFFDDLDTLWQNTSYGKISIDYQVTDLFQLPDDRSDYIDDGDGYVDVNGNGQYDPGVDNPDGDGDGVDGTPCAPSSWGDLSCGDKFTKVLDDAIDDSPAGLDWTDLDAVMVVMAETSAAQFHRGQATSSCNLAMGPGGDTENVGCAIFSENPTETDRQVWGRWAHEIGHAFQQSGPAHPSNYNSEFELMDSNYPGQTGVFEKQSHTGFPGWMPETKYIVVTPESGGETVCLWAMEYDPADKPNSQAVKAEITDSLYYLISVRRRVLGDDLNGDFPNGIPDEGVLIERVSEGSNPWVVVRGRGGNRNQLWRDGDVYDGGADGIQITVTQQIDDDNYCVVVRYDKRADQPDAMLDRWTQPPGNTWETTDIWVDSPVNGYDTYRYGSWNDLSGNPVPRGNGDDPAIGQVNRLYARVRNVGTIPATDVEVTWEITDPPGVGIAGANGWANIGSVDKNDFPGLASIDPGAFVDVYVEWTPDFEISEEDLAAGRFYFHTCVRVKLNHVAGETVFGNQDGDGEQENIDYFQAVPPDEGASRYEDVIRLRNDDLVNPKFFYLSYEDDLPDGWFLDVNGGDRGVKLAPGEVRDIPVIIEPAGPAAVGSIFGVDVSASSLQLLVNDQDPKDQHPEFKPLGGVRVEARVLLPPRLTCRAEIQSSGEVFVEGKLEGVEEFYDEKHPFRVMIEGVDGRRRFLPDTMQVLRVGQDGSFEGYLNPQTKDEPVEVVCLFAGTTELASAASGYVPIAGLETPTQTIGPSFSVQTRNSLGVSGADILTLGLEPGDPPTVTIPAAHLGLVEEDDISAFSYGRDSGPDLESDEPPNEPAPLAEHGSAVVTDCIDFEDLTLGTTYHVGDAFVTSGVTVTARDFIWDDGTAFSGGYATVENGGQAGGSGQEMHLNNITLEFAGAGSVSGLELHFGEYGGNLNIEINGSFQNFSNFADIDGTTIGGVSVSVTNGLGNDHGTLTLTGTINSFAIGGQELWIDDLCPLAEEPPPSEPPEGPEAGPGVVNFSVQAGAAGQPGTAVAAEASCDPAEAAGDEFAVTLPSQNIQVLDEDGTPCNTTNDGYPIGLTLEDNLDALDSKSPETVDTASTDVPDVPVYFSLASDSPSLETLGVTPAHILVSHGGNSPLVFATPEELGLQSGDQIDAIALAENGNGEFDPASRENPEGGDYLVFSLAEGSPTLSDLGLSPGDLLVPNKETVGGHPMLAFAAELSGLLEADDLDALTGYARAIWKLARFPDEKLPPPEPSRCVVNPIGGPEAWHSLAPLPIGREGGFATIIGDRIYVGHGASAFGDDNYHFVYHIPTNSWHPAAPAPIGRAEVTAVCAEENGQGKVFVFGGRGGGGVLDDLYVYDPVTDTWSVRAAMPTPRVGMGAAYVPRLNTIFVVGGRDGTIPHSGAPTDVVEAYDVSAGTWSTMAPMPLPMMDVYSTVYDPHTDKIYVIGGFDGTNVSDAVQIYDVATNSWSLGASMPTARSNLLAGFCGGQIHAIGGYAGPAGTPAPGPEYDVNEAYDPATDTWTTGYLPLPEPRSEFMTQGISTGQDIYAIGDGIHGDWDNVVDVYTCGPAEEGVDLVVDRFTYAGGVTVTIGSPIGDLIDLNVGNTGTADAGSFFVGFYVSDDPTITITDTLLHGGRESVAGLTAGMTTTVKLFSGALVTDTVPPGPAYLGVIVDEQETVIETNELNNTAAIPVTLVSDTAGPSLSIPDNIPAQSGQEVSVPVNFTANGSSIVATMFSVDYDESCLSFDPTDGDADGIPDAVKIGVPAAFNLVSVAFNSGDTDGEIDVTIADSVTPFTALSDGTLATITFTATCEAGTIAPINFSPDPTASFSDASGTDIPGTTDNGSVEILSGTPGDCNSDQNINVADITAIVLEIFDGDGDHPADTPGGTFPGDPVGCNANQDTTVNVSDLICTALIIFDGPGACGGGSATGASDTPLPFTPAEPGAGVDLPAPFDASKLAGPDQTGPALWNTPSQGRNQQKIDSTGPALDIPNQVSASPNSNVTVPVNFTANSNEIASLLFSVDYDETWLSFDATDGDADGIPDAVGIGVPAAFNLTSVNFKASDTDGELDVTIADISPPLTTLSDGTVISITLGVGDPPDGTEVAVNFSQDPAASFSDPSANSISGTIDNGSICVLRADVDGDGDVDVDDVTPVADAWRSPAPDPKYDLDGDGKVTVRDVMLVVKSFGASCAS